jgi:hypothetical protein
LRDLRAFSVSTPTQIDEKEAEKQPKKGRTQYDKVGKYQYLLQKFDTLNKELKQIKMFMRYLAKGLEPSLVFEPEYIQDIACRDEIDKQILEELRYAGEYGMLPRDVAAKLSDKRFTRFYVTARLKQMNKKLDAVLGQRVAEKRGKNWALTSFMRNAWDSTKDEAATDS